MKLLRSFFKIKPRYHVVIAVISFLLMIAALYFHSRADDIGAFVGQMSGKTVGIAVGSADGLINGTREGGEAGAAAGLSAEDTTVDIVKSMEGLGNLEVLVAGVTLKNINRAGKDYAQLTVINGDAVFSVDMTQAEISFNQDGTEVNIKLPQPEVALYLDQDSTQVLAEIQNFSLRVDAEDGLREYLNSIAKITAEARESITNYDSLIEQAKESAQTQVRQLAETISGGKYAVRTRFR